MSAPVQSCQPIPEPARQHTPTPWRVEEGTDLIWGACNSDDTSTYGMGYSIVEGKSGSWGARKPDMAEREANAAFIVEAVNSHATLKAQVEELKSTLREIKAKTEGARPTVNPENAFEHWGKLNAALVSIRGFAREALEAKP